MTTSVEKAKYTTPDGSRTWEYLAIMTCACMAGCLGFIVGWNSPSIVILMADDSPIPVTESAVSTLVAIVAVGHLVAPPLNILLADRFGRRNTMLLSFLPLLVSWGLITIASSIWELYVARFLAGFGAGLFVCVAPMYMGEISSSETRGAANALVGIVYNSGILITFVAAPHLSISFMARIFFVFNVATIFAFWFMPESPYFLVLRNRMDEAEEVLEKLRGKTDVSDELQVVIACLSKKEKGDVKSGSIKDVFSSRGHFRALVIILLFTVTHHFGGFFAIITYCQLIFKSTSNVISDYTIGVVIGVTQVISAVVTTFLVDKVGRKPLILVSGIIAALCNLVIGTFFYAKEYTSIDVQMYSLVPFIASIVSVFMFSCGLVCLQIVLMSEIFATEVKAISTCLIGVIGGLEGIVGFKLYIWVALTLGYGHSIPFLGYFVVVAVCTALIYRITPETKGKTFLEIQMKLNRPG
ncbi:facilitated trehalose transporter Tret1-like [Lasioglossum baleicum]|uniref:facilitated trehalose transporter Tret1-like n=1 Tax=Lasioglossum baleicum TaxID=434251 RepID=UPI003FCD55AD